jgi:hypothetical protein
MTSKGYLVIQEFHSKHRKNPIQNLHCFPSPETPHGARRTRFDETHSRWQLMPAKALTTGLICVPTWATWQLLRAIAR